MTDGIVLTPNAWATIKAMVEWWKREARNIEGWRRRPPIEYVLNQPEFCKIVSADDRNTANTYTVIRVDSNGDDLPGELNEENVPNIRESGVALLASGAFCPLYQMPDGFLLLSESTDGLFEATLDGQGTPSGTVSLTPTAAGLGGVSLSGFEWSIGKNTPSTLKAIDNDGFAGTHTILEAFCNDLYDLGVLVPGFDETLQSVTWTSHGSAESDWYPPASTVVWAWVNQYGERWWAYIAEGMGVMSSVVA